MLAVLVFYVVYAFKAMIALFGIGVLCKAFAVANHDHHVNNGRYRSKNEWGAMTPAQRRNVYQSRVATRG